MPPLSPALRCFPPGNPYSVISCASAAISSGLLNAISLRQQTHGTFVGEATGGKPNHFGEVGSFRLPNSQLLVTYARKFFSTVSGDPASLFPDTTIELSSADYFAGRDPVLENILNR